MPYQKRVEIILLSSGHNALDHRVFDKEAVTLAQHFPNVRVVAAHACTEERNQVQITALSPVRSRARRFLLRPLQCFLAARGSGDRVVILHDAELLLWAPLVKLFTRWRVIYDVHEDFAQLLLRRNWIPIPLRQVMGQGIGILEKSLVRCCDGVMGATEVLADYFVPMPRISLYNLPSSAFIASSSACSRPIGERDYDLVHLGTLSTERLEFLCSVFNELFLRNATARALVIGVEPDQQTLIRERFSEERITVLGKVEYSRIAGYLGNCRVGLDVHPVLYPHLRCAVPVKVFEYIAAGCNVVTSFLPELHRLLGDDGSAHVKTVYTPSPEVFAEEIVRLLDEPAFMCEHQAALMRLLRSRWNWERQAEKLVEFITSYLPEEEMVSREKVFNH